MESTLSLDLTELQAAVGAFLGYGRGPDRGDVEWDEHQQAAIDDCIKSGLRTFYNPPVLPGEKDSYDWSFLRPVASLTLDSGVSTLNLPDDFAGIEGNIIVGQGNTTLGCVVRVGGPAEVLARHQAMPAATGRPAIAAVEPLKETTPTRGQRHQLRIWPTTDAEYTIQVQYYIIPPALTKDRPYPLGGMVHAETIKAACLARAEQTLDDTMTTHTTLFDKYLQASVAADRKLKPQNIGYNGDHSDRAFRNRRRPYFPLTSYNGVFYDYGS